MLSPILREDFDSILTRVTPSLKALAGRELLITGAAGFIGSYLMDFMAYANEHYFERAVKVVGVDNRVAHSRIPATGPGMILTRDLLAHRIDYAIHAASIASPKLYLEKPLATLEANVNLTRRVLEWSTRAEAVLFLSTSEVYGNTPNVPTREDDCGYTAFTNDRAVYSESKRYAELLCHVYHKRFGVPVKVARPFYVFGPGEAIDDGRVVPQLMRAALIGEPFTIYGDGKATRSLCYISDAVEQLFAVLLDGKAGEAYNVGNAWTEISVAGLAALAQELFPMQVETVPTHETLIDAPDRRLPDLSKVMAIAPAPRVGLGTGLARTFTYYVERD